MAGGGEAGLADSFLETPTYVLSIVFALFLAISGAFEVCHHYGRQLLVRRGRHGMANALDKIVMELTLLGFVSLILTAFASPLSHICVPYHESMDGWTMASEIHGCPCCLASTGGMSYCALMQHECLWNITSRQPFCDCQITGSAPYHNGPDEATRNATVADDCLTFAQNEISFFTDTAVNTLASLSVYSNVSVQDVCQAVTAAYVETQAREGMSPEAALEAAGLDAQDGIVLPWEDDSGDLRRRLLGAANDGAGITDPIQVLAYTYDPSKSTQVHVLPRAKLFKCTGSFLSSSCPDGKVPAITANALHEVHIWLFLMATTHVFTCVLQFLLAMFRIMLWRRWDRWARAETLKRSATAALAAAVGAEVAQEAVEAAGPKDGSGKADVAPTPASGAQAAVELAAADRLESGAAAGAAESAAAGAASQAAAPGSGQDSRSRLVRLRSRARNLWSFRPAGSRDWGLRKWLVEAAICVAQALWPNLVTRHKFFIMRQAWLATGAQRSARLAGGGKPGPSPDFVQHVLNCLEDDLTTFVGLSVEMGLCVVVVVLLMGVTGNIGGIALVFLAASLLLGTNTALVALLRHQCRGGRPNRSRGLTQWWATPHFVLAIPLRLLTFLCSFVFSSTILFAWQFGANSCFFTTAFGLWSLWSLPWWSGLVVACIMLAWAGAATVPAYALAAHTHRSTATVRGHEAGHGQHDERLEQAPPQSAAANGDGGEAPKSAGGNAAEAGLRAQVGQLEAQVASLQAHIARLQAAADPGAAAEAGAAAPPSSP